ncbi:MAG: AraC family transcriptional regulator [Chloroflexota bacterium]
MSSHPAERTLSAIARAITYIEAHLRDDVTVADMAAAAGYSLYHFIRTFDQAVFHTPYNYLMRRRISEAARALIDTRRRVIDIAFDYRFNNHETFSRAFKRCFGLQPVQWRERGVVPDGVLMPALTLPYLQHIHRPDFQRPQVCEKPERLLVGLMAPLPENDSQGIARLWASLRQLGKAYWGETAAGRQISVTLYMENGETFFMAGYEVASVDAGPPMLAALRLPAGKYVSVCHRGPVSEVPFTGAYLLHTWLPKASLSPARPLAVYAYEESRCWEVGLPVYADSREAGDKKHGA